VAWGLLEVAILSRRSVSDVRLTNTSRTAERVVGFANVDSGQLFVSAAAM
jgi:hypothetical protein